jgi:DNA-directed RNA polymerase subunit F
MRDELRNLNSIKLKEEHFVKIVDFMPEDAADVIKVLPGISLNQDEITQILEIVKKY